MHDERIRTVNAVKVQALSLDATPNAFEAEFDDTGGPQPDCYQG